MKLWLMLFEIALVVIWLIALCRWIGQPVNPDEKNDDGFI